MAKRILAVLAALLAAFVGYVATRPGQYVVTRQAKLAAGADVIFPMVNDFHQWKAWSPWDGLDPKMTVTFDGPAAGVGAGYAWKGNDEVGEGRMTILDSQPNQLVAIKLEFLKPFEALNTTRLALAAAGPDTVVTWTMEGSNNFVGKAAGIFMNMDAMIGKDFEKGLGSLKALAEAEAKKRAAGAPAPAVGAPAAPADAGP